jgi:hypothetical protein
LLFGHVKTTLCKNRRRKRIGMHDWAAIRHATAINKKRDYFFIYILRKEMLQRTCLFIILLTTTIVQALVTLPPNNPLIDPLWVLFSSELCYKRTLFSNDTPEMILLETLSIQAIKFGWKSWYTKKMLLHFHSNILFVKTHSSYQLCNCSI